MHSMPALLSMSESYLVDRKEGGLEYGGHDHMWNLLRGIGAGEVGKESPRHSGGV